jgi:regulator of PEP synthase PpsR (kinase-PPPase family)
MYHVFVVSDGTGSTAERVLSAALTQFEGKDVQIDVRTEVRTQSQIHKIIKEAVKLKAFIIHTLVSNDMRQLMIHEGRLHNLETIDLMGPLLSRLSQQFSVTPLEKPGLFRQLNESYFRRIETMDFAVKHDDGQRVHELHQAEIILVGVSRTFKTPLSIYLAFKHWLVANVPIIINIEPPSILKELPPNRIFGLTMDTRRLASLRQVRSEYLGGSVGEYAELDFVQREVVYALKYFKTSPKWPVINVTGKPIEEIASEILTIVGKHH